MADMQRPSSLLLLPLILVGCGSDAPAPDKVRARIASDLVAVADQATASTAEGQSFPDTTSFAILQSAVGGQFGDLLDVDTGSTVPFIGQVKTRIASLMAPRAGTRTTKEQQLLAEEDGDLDFDGAEAAQWLNDNIFTDANHKGDGVYDVPASLVCTEEGILDEDCAEAWDRIDLRVRVSENDDTLRFALQLGPNHDEPLEIGLSAKLLSVTVDLDETEDVVKALMPKGEESPNFSLTGEVTAKLEITGANAARISLDVDRNVRVQFAEAGDSLSGPNAFDFSTGKAHVFALALDGNQKSMEATLGLARSEAHIPGDELDPRVDFVLPGLTGTAKYAEGLPLRLSGISLGNETTTLKMDGTLALAVDLNANDGRKFDAQLSNNLLEVTPRVDFRAQVNHAALDDAQPVYDVTRIFLEGGLKGRTDDRVEVTGAFSIETNPASFGFAATAGQCVGGTEIYDSVRDDYYTQFSVGTCN
jgi:hypothetical protein